MDYHQYGVRLFELEGNLFPPPRQEHYQTGQLSKLYAAVNEDDIFDSCATRGVHSADFQGEHHSLNVEGSTITITATSFRDVVELKVRFGHLLEQSLKVLGARHVFLVDRIRIAGLVPEGSGKDVGALIQRKATKLKAEHYAHLPGTVDGAALEIAGYCERPDQDAVADDPDANDDEFRGLGDGFSYKITIAPYLTQPNTLFLEVRMRFDFPIDTDELTKGIERVQEQIQIAYDFATNNVVAFAASFLP